MKRTTHRTLLTYFRRPGILPTTVALVGLLIGPSVSSAETYSVTDLGVFLDGVASDAVAINNLGQVVVYSLRAGHDYRGYSVIHAALWRSGARTDLSLPAGAEYVAIEDINNSGQMVGFVESINGDNRAVLWNGGTPSNLFNTRSIAHGISDAGEVLVRTTLEDGSYPDVLWRVGSYSLLSDLFNDTSVSGYDVNTKGQIAGTSRTLAPDGTEAYVDNLAVMSAGSVHTVGFFSSAVWPKHINEKGDIIGTYAKSSGGIGSFVYQNGTVAALGNLGGDATTVYGLNNAGDVVGESEMSDGVTHAFVYRGGKMQDLNSLLPQPSSWVLLSARSINDSGYIVGQGIVDSQLHGYLLTPSSSIVYGDLNSDGSVTFQDVSIALRLAAGLSVTGTSLAGDVAPKPSSDPRGFGDGRENLLDVLRILRRARGLEPSWP